MDGVVLVSELPSFFVLASLVFQNQGLQVFSVFILRAKSLNLRQQVLFYFFRQLLWRMALAAAAASLDDKAFWAFLQIDSLPCGNSFVVIDFKPPCRFTVAQLFFHHGFHDQLLEFRRISLVFRMSSNELKHEAKKQEWNIAIQECRSSGLSVSEWCRQQGVTTTLLASFSGIPLSFAEAQILPSKKTVKMLRSGLKK